MTYREYSPNDRARTDFFQNLTYDSSSKIIRFKDYKIRIKEATNQSIKFVVLSD